MNTSTDTARPYQPIEGYEILARLGGGGMGTVFRARQIAMDRVVALKVLKSNLAKDEKYVERLHREARLLGVLDHPNIVKAHDVGHSNGYHYFVMEYVEGRSMAALLAEEGPLPSDLVLDVAIQMARALEHSHRHDIIHRDIKPGNILLTDAGLAKLTDLGLAKREIDPGLTRDEATVGTPQYISPEQLLAPKTVDGRSDIFSLGASLFHLLTGQPPFAGETLGQVVASVLAGRLTDPMELRSDIDPGFASILVRMLQREAKHRYPSATELLADLEAVRAGREPEPWTPPSESAPPRRPWIAAASLVVLIAIGAVIFWPSSDSKAPPDESSASNVAWHELETRLRQSSGPHERLAILEGLDAAQDPELAARIREREYALENELRTRYEEIAAELIETKARPLLTKSTTSPAGEDRLAASTYERLFAPRGPSAERLFRKEFLGRADVPTTGRAFGIWGEVLSNALEEFESERRASIAEFRKDLLAAIRSAQEQFEMRLDDSGDQASLVIAQEELGRTIQGLAEGKYGSALIALSDLPEASVADLHAELEALRSRLQDFLALRSRERLSELQQRLQRRFQEARDGLEDLDLGVSEEAAIESFNDWVAQIEAGRLSLILEDERATFRSGADALEQALANEFRDDQRRRADERFLREVSSEDNVVLQLLGRREYEKARQRLEEIGKLYPRAEVEPQYWGLLVDAIDTFVTEGFRHLHREVQRDNTQEVKASNGIGSSYLINSVSPEEHRFQGMKLQSNPGGEPREVELVELKDIHVSDLLDWGRQGHADTEEREALRRLGEALFLRVEKDNSPADALVVLKPLVGSLEGRYAAAAQRLHAKIELDIAEAALTREELINRALTMFGEVDQLKRKSDSESLEEALELIKELLATRYQSLGLKQLEGLPELRTDVQARLKSAEREEELRKPYHAPVRVLDASVEKIQVVYAFNREDELLDWNLDPEIWSLDGGALVSQASRGVKNLFDNRHGIRHPARGRRELKQFDIMANRGNFELAFDYEAPEGVEPELLAVSIYGLNVGIWSQERRVWAWTGGLDKLDSSEALRAREVSPAVDLLEEWGTKYRVKISIESFGPELDVALYVAEEAREVWAGRVPRIKLRDHNALPQVEIRSFRPAILDNITLTGQLKRR
ncbi:MAG: protein kinase [Planctomycetota bacterium]